MVDQELLQAMRAMIKEEMEPINKRLDGIDERLSGIDERLERLEEHTEITRDGVNSLLEWAEECGNTITFPLPKVK